MSDEAETYGPAHFGMFLVVTAVIALALKVFPALNSVPEEPEATWVSPSLLGVYVAVAGAGAFAVGIWCRVKMRHNRDRWENAAEVTAAIAGGAVLAGIGMALIL